ncbi:hypothetical protein [Desulfuromonas sp. AOP6]|uniref:hypothetical protein n=1 Tax=Desulfuromonas sp. AOP6 TaxID=1566351 RepID=UPI00126E1A35|nr:hypothetical protein [Desulfuromonas sp. AOP6]BCA79913.1 hypothetical protein AOP6_1700 [Desulfuromonas sp. AOP6]
MMKPLIRLSVIFALLLAFVPVSGFAASNEELERRLDLITEELQKLKNESAVEDAEYSSTFGYGPAASKVYKLNQGLSIGGYGEGQFKNYTSDKGDKIDQADMLRAILYFGYKFTDNIILNTEIEIEHADEIYVEMASLDFLLHDKINLRGGLLLAPVGLTNELHEPTLFHGVDRPLVERQVIPSTWREMGVGAFGSLTDNIDYKLYVMNGFDGADFTSQGLRGGRQKASQTKAEDWALVGRLDYEPILGLTIGGSFYLGDSGQGQVVDTSNREADVFTEIYEIHSQYKVRGLELKALASQVKIDDAEAIGADVPDEIFAYYGEAAYNVLPHLFRGTSHYLAPFVRYENLDYDGNNEDVELLVTGLSYKPIPNVVIKADYSNFDKKDGVRADELNIGFGYIF